MVVEHFQTEQQLIVALRGTTDSPQSNHSVLIALTMSASGSKAQADSLKRGILMLRNECQSIDFELLTSHLPE